MVADFPDFIRIAKQNFLEKSFKEDPEFMQPVFSACLWLSLSGCTPF